MFILSDCVSYADSENPSFGLIRCKITLIRLKAKKPQKSPAASFKNRCNSRTVHARITKL